MNDILQAMSTRNDLFSQIQIKKYSGLQSFISRGYNLVVKMIEKTKNFF